MFPTPVSIVESFFGVRLHALNRSFWNEVREETWIEFARAYLAAMKAGFTAEALAPQTEKPLVRLYFDRGLVQDYEKEISGRQGKTPLLSHSPYPDPEINYIGAGISKVLDPLKKHLLVADELVIPDNFYCSFDSVADSYNEAQHDNPNIASMVRYSIDGILRWLPILTGLRDLIESGVIVFFPYYAVPSFPYHSGSERIEKEITRLVIPREPGILLPNESAGFDFSTDWTKPPGITGIPETKIDYTALIYAWVNARLLGFDPVFAQEKGWRWASQIKLRTETRAQAVSDLFSMDLLPLGRKKELSLEDIMSMRKNEYEFSHIRETLIACKEYVRDNVKESASNEFLTKVCREYIKDHLDPDQRLGLIKLLDNNLFAGTALSIAISAAFLTASPWVGLLAPAALTPKLALALEARINPKMRAVIKLETLF